MLGQLFHGTISLLSLGFAIFAVYKEHSGLTILFLTGSGWSFALVLGAYARYRDVRITKTEARHQREQKEGDALRKQMQDRINELRDDLGACNSDRSTLISSFAIVSREKPTHGPAHAKGQEDD